jgi:uncharacterized protein
MAVEVRHNPEQQRYELTVDGELSGVADYRPSGEALVFPHTEIHPTKRGRDLGARLVRAALDDVRERGERVIPTCWYVARFIDENPDYADLLA